MISSVLAFLIYVFPLVLFSDSKVSLDAYQIKKIESIVKNHSQDTDYSNLIKDLNKVLGTKQSIFLSPELKVKVTSLTSEGNSVVGFEIRDGRHHFCLPCSTGLNTFQWGVSPVVPRNIKGPYSAYLSCFEDLQEAGANRSGSLVNTESDFSMRYIPIKANGELYILTDDSYERFATKGLKGADVKHTEIKLPGERKSIVQMTENFIEEYRGPSTGLSMVEVAKYKGSAQDDEGVRVLQKSVLNKFDSIMNYNNPPKPTPALCRALSSCLKIQDFDRKIQADKTIVDIIKEESQKTDCSKFGGSTIKKAKRVE